MRVLTATHLVLATLLAAPRPAAAQEVIDRGTFRLYREGRVIGEERFVIRSERAGETAVIKAIGTVSLERDGETLQISAALEASGPELNPTGYQVETTDGGRRRIAGVVQRGRFLARILSPRGEQLKEYVVSEGALILDEYIAHHHYFLALRAARGIGRVPIIVPQQNEQIFAQVEVVGVESTEVGGRTMQLTHIVLRPQNQPVRHVWADDRYRVMKVEIPEAQFRAVRIEEER